MEAHGSPCAPPGSSPAPDRAPSSAWLPLQTAAGLRGSPRPRAPRSCRPADGRVPSGRIPPPFRQSANPLPHRGPGPQPESNAPVRTPHRVLHGAPPLLEQARAGQGRADTQGRGRSTGQEGVRTGPQGERPHRPSPPYPGLATPGLSASYFLLRLPPHGPWKPTRRGGAVPAGRPEGWAGGAPREVKTNPKK